MSEQKHKPLQAQWVFQQSRLFKKTEGRSSDLNQGPYEDLRLSDLSLKTEFTVRKSFSFMLVMDSFLHVYFASLNTANSFFCYH